LNVDTDIITSIAARLLGQDVILAIIKIKTISVCVTSNITLKIKTISVCVTSNITLKIKTISVCVTSNITLKIKTITSVLKISTYIIAHTD
jgi:hypothetical protein